MGETGGGNKVDETRSAVQAYVEGKPLQGEWVPTTSNYVLVKPINGNTFFRCYPHSTKPLN